MITKYYSSVLLIFSLSTLVNQAGFAQSKMLAKGDTAPLFTTQASLAGKAFEFSLKNALAKGSVVVYFYPSAYTGGCDIEAHTFAELKDKFTTAGATIIGVSADDIQRLNAFSSDSSYCAGKFPVASDPGGQIASTYGLIMSAAKTGIKDLLGQDLTHGFIPRTTFVINKEGKIIAVFSSATDHISPADHVEKSLAIVQHL
ncbi:MAG TPA: peroxiredoxin [Puia sp.]|jgi:peroxiredoxin